VYSVRPEIYRVKWFNGEKGYAHNPADGRKDPLVRHSAIQGSGFRSLNEGGQVGCDPEKGQEGTAGREMCARADRLALSRRRVTS